MNLEYIRELAAEQMMNRRSHPSVEWGNKYYHGQRVARMVIELRKELFPDCSDQDEVLIVAAWFHDIANDRSDPTIDHQEVGAVMTRSILKDVCLPDELDRICELIQYHDTRYPDNKGMSDWVKLLQDADLLDHLGIFDIWYIFSQASQHKMPIPELFEWFQMTRPAKDEQFYYDCNFALSRRIMLEKSRFVYDFGQRYMAEGSGKIWNKEAIVEAWKSEDGGKLYGEEPEKACDVKSDEAK